MCLTFGKIFFVKFVVYPIYFPLWKVDTNNVYMPMLCSMVEGGYRPEPDSDHYVLTNMKISLHYNADPVIARE